MTPHDKNKAVRDAVIPVLNLLNRDNQITVMDINAAVFALITCSMEQAIGRENARDFIVSAMDNVWGKPKKKWWQI